MSLSTSTDMVLTETGVRMCTAARTTLTRYGRGRELDDICFETRAINIHGGLPTVQ